MSVLIKGIDLPEAYTSALLAVYECVGGHAFMKTYRVSAEQIQVIPLHGRLIDASTKIEAQLYDEMTEEWSLKNTTVDDFLAFAADVPATIIEAEEGEEA